MFALVSLGKTLSGFCEDSVDAEGDEKISKIKL